MIIINILLYVFSDSANHANGEVIPQKDAQPEGSTVGPTDDAKLVF